MTGIVVSLGFLFLFIPRCLGRNEKLPGMSSFCFLYLEKIASSVNVCLEIMQCNKSHCRVPSHSLPLRMKIVLKKIKIKHYLWHSPIECYVLLLFRLFYFVTRVVLPTKNSSWPRAAYGNEVKAINGCNQVEGNLGGDNRMAFTQRNDVWRKLNWTTKPAVCDPITQVYLLQDQFPFSLYSSYVSTASYLSPQWSIYYYKFQLFSWVIK